MKELSDAFPYNDEDISFKSVGENALRSENGHRLFADVLRNRLVKNGIAIKDVEKTFVPDFSKKFLPWFFENYGEEIEKMAVAACEFYISDSPEFNDEIDDDMEIEIEIEDDPRELSEAMYYDNTTGTFAEDESPAKNEFDDIRTFGDIDIEDDVSDDYPTLEDLYDLEDDFLDVIRIVKLDVIEGNNISADVDDYYVDMPMGQSTQEILSRESAKVICSTLKMNGIECSILPHGKNQYAVAHLSDGSRYKIIPDFSEHEEISITRV